MRYRPEIDGLRSIAVLPVVLFHAGVPGFPGGFVGVDIFFVISGYLITGMIAEEIRQGSFTVVGFYERRIRRIFPALIVMLAACTVTALWLLFPDDLLAFARSVVATALFGSNFLFWKESGYFDAPAADKPLLHTWSLAVEEQFYIFFPIFLWLLWRWHARYWVAWVAAVTIASFALSAWAVRDHANAAFYLLPTRAWELFLGGLLALNAFPAIRNRVLRETAALLGLALIVWGVSRLDTRSPFPGPNALFPCLGAALLIWTGAETAIGRMLATSPFRGIGLISYSLYLWHWPVIVFLHQAGVFLFTPTITLGVIGVSIALAWASWKFVETPFRQRRRFDRKQIFALGLSGMTAVCLVGATGAASDGMPDRFPTAAIAIVGFEDSFVPKATSCLISRRKSKDLKNCTFGASVEPTFAVWGDSHSAALVAQLGEVAAKHGKSIMYYGHAGCPPIIGVEVVNDRTCGAFNRLTMAELTRRSNIKTVILIARYYSHVYGQTTGPDVLADDPLMSDSSFRELSVSEAETLFAEKLPATVAALHAAGKRVVVSYPIPEPGYDVPRVLAARVAKGGDPSTLTQPFDIFLDRQKLILSVLDGLKDVVRVYPSSAFCDNVTCHLFGGGSPLYRDRTHPSTTGAELIAGLFDRVFQ